MERLVGLHSKANLLDGDSAYAADEISAEIEYHGFHVVQKCFSNEQINENRSEGLFMWILCKNERRACVDIYLHAYNGG